MKINKYTKTAIVFTVAASVFVTTAFADMMLGSGYDKLKKSIKNATYNLSETYDSYSVSQSLEFYLDGELLHHNYTLTKVDRVNKQKHELYKTTNAEDQEHSYESEYYQDSYYWLHKYEGDSYSGSKYTNENVDFDPGENYNEIFTSEYSAEFENIFDAAVGNLKNLVQYESDTNGHKNYTGTLNASQVPPLYNAVLSLLLKEGFSYELKNDEKITELNDAYVSTIAGEAKENEEGHLTYIEGQLELKFNDQNNKAHSILAVMTLEITDINKTVIEKPAFDESKLELVTPHDKNAQYILTDKFVGTYISPIVYETEDSFVKIGERKITFTEITNTNIVGTFEEVYYPSEYTNDLTANSFKFDGVKDGSYLIYTNPTTNETNYASIYQSGSAQFRIEFGLKMDADGYMTYPSDSYDAMYLNSGDFTKVFE